MPASMPRPIAVSDAQMSAILNAATPLEPLERSVFLASLAHRLRQEAEPPGDGSLNRIIRQVLLEIRWTPPAIDHMPKPHRRVGEPLA